MSKQESTKKQKQEEQDDVLFMGTVAWFNRKKDGYGFITPEGKEVGTDDVFVHVSQVEPDDSGKTPTLQPGDTVSFVVGNPPENNSKKKPMAMKVKLIERADEEEKK